MRAAAQPQVVDRCWTAIRERHNVVQFEKSCFFTTPISADKRTSSRVAFPHLTFHCSRHMTSVRTGRLTRTRPLKLRQSSSLEVFEQERERSVKNDRRVSIWANLFGEYGRYPDPAVSRIALIAAVASC